MADKAWVTLATNDTYALGALVLAHSLKKVNTAYKLVVLVSSNVTFAMRGTLQSIYDEVKEVNILDSGDAENLRLLARPELGITFTKLHCWKLTQYEKCVFLDADTLVLQNCDELFEREELSAAPDVGWPDCFNSGVFVFKPSEKTFKELYDFAIANGSFDGGDQGLLNMFFSSWATSDASKRLPFLYNLSSAAIYSYLPAFKWYGKGVKIVHFIGNSKPWTQPFNSSTRTVEAAPGASHLQNFLQYWWDLFCACVYTQLSPEMAGLANSLSQMVLEEPTPEQKAREDFLRRQNWEQGNIDYMGKDSFSNIWEKISQTINPEPESKAEEKVPVVESSSTSPATSEQPSQPPVLQICPIKPPTSSQPSEEPLSCPKPPKPAATEPAPPSQPVAVSTPPATVVEKPATEPAVPVCLKSADASPVCQKPVAPKEASVPTPADASPVCQKPVAPKEAPVPTPAEASPVCQKPVAPVPTSAEASPVCQKPVAPVPTPAEASPVCQKPVAPKETTESVKAKVEQPAAPVAKSSQEVKSAPEQDPKTKTATKPSPSKK